MIGLTACSSDDKPKDLLEEGKMANIMTDIHLIEAEINNLHLQHQDSSIFIYQHLKVRILKKYNTDTATFNASFKYYVLNPDKMKPIYAEVKKKLEDVKKKKMASQKPQPQAKPQIPPKRDSLKKVLTFPRRIGKTMP
jgi:hypothetical protein